MPKKVIILNSEQIEQRIIRIAYQILEDSIEEKELVFAGIADRGYIFAERIINELKKISKQKISLIKISLDKDSTSLNANTDKDVSDAKDKVVILVDDVLNSGRTLAYGLSVFLNVPLKKMRVVVLIDRSHHDYPVYSDFAGLKLSTVLKEHVSVIFSDKPGEDAAYLS
ncbi:phosphoribosyltransferase family protein [Albibacterium bauzanense]|uniref:Pyrimidine operon attenuation protein/uracil phosphoribosyltransferase n=1 Tax=Albibacterium bauzanense TaxID=653929 RepID=A0A4R1LUM4_9SPHI|nr:phosphoribosyltransferase family protein [Albibacterium bauzanense]TCK83058.1 pyrimidine operon attenuation protein/uracil phosphoribosyltransferase [Albibacterium bauzanense]